MAFTKTPRSPEDTKELRRQRAREDYYRNQEARRAQQNLKRAENPEGVRAAARARRAAKPEAYRAYGRKEQALRREKFPWLAAFHSRRKHAEKKGIPFTITVAWAKASYTGYCALTGLPFDVRLQGHVGNPGPRPHSISIDKVDALKGYTPDNCRFVLNAVNTMRGSGTDATMVAIAAALLAKRLPNS